MIDGGVDADQSIDVAEVRERERRDDRVPYRDVDTEGPPHGVGHGEWIGECQLPPRRRPELDDLAVRIEQVGRAGARASRAPDHVALGIRGGDQRSGRSASSAQRGAARARIRRSGSPAEG